MDAESSAGLRALARTGRQEVTFETSSQRQHDVNHSGCTVERPTIFGLVVDFLGPIASTWCWKVGVFVAL